MASGTADLQRDLGGAIMQSILGALLTAGYAVGGHEADRRVARTRRRSPTACRTQLTKSFSSAANLATQYPQYSKQIIAAAKQSFVDGQDWAYFAGIIADSGGAALVFFFFPKQDHEDELLASTTPKTAPRPAATAQQGTPELHACRSEAPSGGRHPRHPTFHRWTADTTRSDSRPDG